MHHFHLYQTAKAPTPDPKSMNPNTKSVQSPDRYNFWVYRAACVALEGVVFHNMKLFNVVQPCNNPRYTAQAILQENSDNLRSVEVALQQMENSKASGGDGGLGSGLGAR